MGVPNKQFREFFHPQTQLEVWKGATGYVLFSLFTLSDDIANETATVLRNEPLYWQPLCALQIIRNVSSNGGVSRLHADEDLNQGKQYLTTHLLK